MTNVQSNLAKGRIVDLLSSLAAASGFVRFWPHLLHGSLDPMSQLSRSVQPFCTPVWPTQTDKQTTLRATFCSGRRHLFTACMRHGL